MQQRLTLWVVQNHQIVIFGVFLIDSTEEILGRLHFHLFFLGRRGQPRRCSVAGDATLIVGVVVVLPEGSDSIASRQMRPKYPGSHHRSLCPLILEG
jgi:hypothetical protein